MRCASHRGAAHALAALAATAAALIMGACSKSEPQSTKATPNAPLEAPRARVSAQAGGDTGEDTERGRIARQEAAARMFDKSIPESERATPAPLPAFTPAPNPTPAPAPATAPAPALRIAAPAPLKPAPAEAKKGQEPQAPEPAKAAAPEPAKDVPAPAPRVELAAAKPASAPATAPAATTARLVSRVDPEFPREAVQAGVDRGNVKARMTLDAGGNVTRVEVVEAAPRRMFDRAVVRALSQWRFSDGASGRTVETEVDFKR